MNRKHYGCKHEGCERKHCSKGYCSLHYSRLKKNGTSEFIFKGRSPNGYNKSKEEQCSIDGCTKSFHAVEYCIAHYHRFNRYGDPYAKTQEESTNQRRAISAAKISPETVEAYRKTVGTDREGDTIRTIRQETEEAELGSPNNKKSARRKG